MLRVYTTSLVVSVVIASTTTTAQQDRSTPRFELQHCQRQQRDVVCSLTIQTQLGQAQRLSDRGRVRAYVVDDLGIEYASALPRITDELLPGFRYPFTVVVPDVDPESRVVSVVVQLSGHEYIGPRISSTVAVFVNTPIESRDYSQTDALPRRLPSPIATARGEAFSAELTGCSRKGLRITCTGVLTNIGERSTLFGIQAPGEQPRVPYLRARDGKQYSAARFSLGTSSGPRGFGTGYLEPLVPLKLSIDVVPVDEAVPSFDLVISYVVDGGYDRTWHTFVMNDIAVPLEPASNSQDTLQTSTSGPLKVNLHACATTGRDVMLCSMTVLNSGVESWSSFSDNLRESYVIDDRGTQLFAREASTRGLNQYGNLPENSSASVQLAFYGVDPAAVECDVALKIGVSVTFREVPIVRQSVILSQDNTRSSGGASRLPIASIVSLFGSLRSFIVALLLAAATIGAGLWFAVRAKPRR